ncbi:hypothetical protein KRM28CT15_03170 [Krasilnikovia sp. M28-CT-15]
MIVVSPSTGTSAFGSVSVYGRSLRPAPAASTRPIMGFLPQQGCRTTRIAACQLPSVASTANPSSAIRLTIPSSTCRFLPDDVPGIREKLSLRGSFEKEKSAVGADDDSTGNTKR